MLVRDIWYEGNPKEYLDLRDSGDFVQCGHKIAPNKSSGHEGIDSIHMTGKSGQVLMAQSALDGADLVLGQLASGFQVTLFGLTPNPGTSIRYADQISGRSDMGDGRSDDEKSKSAGNSISNIQNPISNQPSFVQLMCRQNNVQVTGSVALPDVNANGDISNRFQILRDWKLPDPDLPAKVILHRVRCEGGVGMVVVSAKPKTN